MIYKVEKFIIRGFENGDEASLALNANNEKIWNNLSNIFPHPYTYDDAIDWVNYNLGLSTPLNFAIVVNGDCVGSVGIVPGTDIHDKNLQIGYWIGEEFWGQGISSEAVKWLVDYCKNNFDVHKVWASVFSNNMASIKVLEKCGFEYEATLKENFFKNKAYFDEKVYSLFC